MKWQNLGDKSVTLAVIVIIVLCLTRLIEARIIVRFEVFSKKAWRHFLNNWDI